MRCQRHYIFKRELGICNGLQLTYSYFYINFLWRFNIPTSSPFCLASKICFPKGGKSLSKYGFLLIKHLRDKTAIGLLSVNVAVLFKGRILRFIPFKVNFVGELTKQLGDNVCFEGLFGTGYWVSQMVQFDQRRTDGIGYM